MTALFHKLLPKQTLTVLAGMLANVQWSWIKDPFIRWFIRHYQVNMLEALNPDPKSYPCFNDFFIRRLHPNARQLAQAPVICPVDGSISELGRIEAGQLLQAKGRYYSAQTLLQNETHGFQEGHFMTLYLSPKDYHRIHMPIAGTVHSMIYVPGRLFSVQPATTRAIPNLFAENERVVVFFETTLGRMAMVLVGATIVGRIATDWHGEFKRSNILQTFTYPKPIHLEQGQEMGYFKLGSTVILLFEKDAPIQWLETLQAGTVVKFGQEIV